jgi:hypothetical protein
MRRRSFFRVLVIGSAALIVAALAFRPRECPFTEERVNRINLGMARPEIEAKLGPPGDYTTGPLWYTPDSDFCGFSVQAMSRELVKDPQRRFMATNALYAQSCWSSDDLVFVVAFDSEGKAWQSSIYRVRRAPNSLESFFLRIERQWERWTMGL